MFNRFLNKITDGGKASPSRNGTSGGDEIPSPTDYDMPIAAEGFLCPTCMLGFPSPETLQDHYETSHVGNDVTLETGGAPGIHVCSACKMKMGSAVELESHYARHHIATKNQDQENSGILRQELDEMHTSLKEERWYSEELKKEVCRLQSSVEFVRADGEQRTDAEVFYQNQIRILEESKNLALSEVVLLKEHLNDSREELSRARSEKDKLEQKAATLAGELADTKSQLDETAGDRSDFTERLKESQKQVADLQAEVEQRLGSEDALLLRQELVTVQNLMDQLTLEKEAEKDHLQKICNDLEAEKVKLMSALEEAPDQAAMERLRNSVSALTDSNTEKETALTLFKSEMDRQLSETLLAGQRDLQAAQQQTADAAEKQMAELRAALESSTQALDVLRLREEKTTSEMRSKSQQEAQESLQRLITSQAECEKFARQLQDCQTEAEQLKMKASQYETKLGEKEILIKDLSGKITNNASALLKSENLIKESNENISNWENNCRKLKDQIERLETERTELYEKIESGDGAKTAIQQLQQENAAMQEKIAKQQETYDDLQDTARKSLENINLNLQQETEKRELTEKEINILRNKLAEDQIQITELAEKITEVKEASVTREKEISDLKGKHMSEKLSLEHQLASKQAELQEAQRQIESLQSTANETNKKISADQKKNSELATNLQKLRDASTHSANVIASHEAKINSLQQELSKTAEALTQSQTHSVKIEKKSLQKDELIKKREAELTSVQSKVTSLTSDLQTLTGFKETLAEEVNQWRESSSMSERQLDEVRTLLTVAETEIGELKSSKAELEESVTRLESKERALQDTAQLAQENAQREAQKLAQLQEELTKMRDELRIEVEKVESSNREIETSKLTVENLEKLVADVESSANLLSHEKSQLASNLQERIDEIEKVNTRNKEWETTCFNLEEKLKYSEERLTEESDQLAAAEEGKALLIAQKLKVQSELEEAILKWKNVEANQAVLVNECKLKENTLKSQIGNLAEQLNEEKNVWSRAQQTWEDDRSRLEGQAGVLSENLSTLQHDLVIEKNKNTTLETKVDELGGYKLELEAKLENALDERRALLDRCLRSEDEGETLRTVTTDLRSKLEDTLAALHELGRENQSLQIENTKLVQRKWAEDAEVTHCTACRKQFTVTLRKHHCRSCGSIFCNECSARTSMIASYKKAVRVCDSCFEEVGQ